MRSRDEPRVATDPRISRRRSAVARSKRRRLVAAATTVIALGAVSWAALASPLLAVDEVRVVGAEHTTTDDVVRVAGLGSEDNLLLVSTDAIAAAVETLPWVKKAEVDRMLPGTVRVRVTERVPALVLTVGAARWTIDIRGHILTTGAAVKGLPTLAGVETGDVEVGAKLRSQELRDALEAFRALSRGVRKKVTSVVAPSLERISFSLASGTLIRFGAAENLAAKNEVISALLAELAREQRTVAYIDVRVPASPAIAPAIVAPPATTAPTDEPKSKSTPKPSPTDD